MPSKFAIAAAFCSSIPLATARLTSQPLFEDCKATFVISGYGASLSRIIPEFPDTQGHVHLFAFWRLSGATMNLLVMGATATFK